MLLYWLFVPIRKASFFRAEGLKCAPRRPSRHEGIGTSQIQGR